MKKYFTTGLAIILPVVLTLIIVGFLVNLLTKPFMGMVESMLQGYDILNHDIFYIKAETLLTILSKIVIVVFICGITLLVGLIGQWFLIHYFFRFTDELFHRIPLISSVYKSVKDVVHSLFSHDKPSFSKVVLVPFPHSKSLSIGLVTNDVPGRLVIDQQDLVSVLLPGTPNPMMGFMLMYRRDQIIMTNLSVEQAIKMVVSCGAIYNFSETKSVATPPSKG